MLNKVMLVGVLTSRSARKQISEKKTAVDFTVTIEREWRGGQGGTRFFTDVVDVSAFREDVHSALDEMKQGDLIAVDGIVSSIPYQKDGVEKRFLRVTAFGVQKLVSGMRNPEQGMEDPVDETFPF